MKKIYAGLFLLGAAVAFTYCSSSKKSTGTAATTPAAPAKQLVNYQANVMSIIQTNCAPCHFPDKGGNKKALDSYASVKANVDEIIRRIELQPTDRGFMPNRKPKLADADINTIKQWKADGLTEK
jgi:mono/diheme cytochrome c family protein